MHAWGTVLNCEHIGKGCSFLQNTTFGNKLNKDGVYVRPWLGDNVDVGANVVVIGGVRIGNNVKIGAGSVVTKDIPDNCTVVGVPGRVVQQKVVNHEGILMHNRIPDPIKCELNRLKYEVQELKEKINP